MYGGLTFMIEDINKFLYKDNVVKDKYQKLRHEYRKWEI